MRNALRYHTGYVAVPPWTNWLLPTMAVGAALGLLVLKVQGRTPYQLALLACLGLLLVVMAAIGNIRKVLMLSLALAIPVSVNFSPFAKNLPYHPGGAYNVLSFTAYDLPLLGLIVLWLADALMARRRARPSMIDAAAFSLIVWSALSIINAVQPSFSAFEILRMVKLYMLAVVVAAYVKSKRELIEIFAALLVGLVIESGFSVIQYVKGDNFGFTPASFGDLHRVAGTVGWPNTFGAYAATLIAIALFLWALGAGGKKLRPLLMVAGLVGVFPLIQTFSRGAWISLLIAAVLGLVVAGRAGHLGPREKTRVATIALLTGAVGLFFAGAITARLSETTIGSASIQDRFGLIEVALNMIAAHPILGIGLNNFANVMHQYDTTGVTYAFPEPVHNVYLLVAAETGIMGLCLFLWLIVATFQAGLQAVRARDPFLSASAIAVLAGLAVLLISNLADVHLRTDVIYGLFWLLIGLTLAIRKMADTREGRGRA